ncbi:hypothetical protein F5884DRAFT_764314 [Xylogone sp. PMI_703]|nr:hypothetical protein F5884DRAFT_764314 [Xylogone sp. PMI_703]
MKISFSLFALLPLALAITMPHKSVIITFPDDTPTDVINKAKDTIVQQGGKITHEYNLFKGFAAETPENALNTVQTLDSKYNPTIEEDQVVKASG